MSEWRKDKMFNADNAYELARRIERMADAGKPAGKTFHGESLENGEAYNPFKYWREPTMGSRVEGNMVGWAVKCAGFEPLSVTEAPDKIAARWLGVNIITSSSLFWPTVWCPMSNRVQPGPKVVAGRKGAVLVLRQLARLRGGMKVTMGQIHNAWEAACVAHLLREQYATEDLEANR